jgi:hypothetical protein
MITFIDEHRAVHGVEPICRVLPIARRRITPTPPGAPIRVSCRHEPGAISP